MEGGIKMKNKKILMVLLMVFLCGAGVSGFNSNVSAKIYNTNTSVKKDLEKQNKKLEKLKKQYKDAVEKEKQAKEAYKKQQKGVKTIIMGDVISIDPFIVYSSYILSPCRGYYLISNGTSLLGTYTGDIKLTGGTYQYGNVVCQMAKDVSLSKEEKKYDAAKNKTENIGVSVKICKDRISRLEKLLKNSVKLNDIEITNGETIKYKDWDYKLDIWDDDYSGDFSKIKWKSSGSSIVSVINNVTTKNKKPVLKAKKKGTVILSATYMTSKKTTTCKVKVIPKITEIRLSTECIEMPKNKKIKISDYISAKCYPKGVSQKVDFIVEDDKSKGIIIDNEKGTIKAGNEGIYTVYARPSGSRDVEASFKVLVYDNEWFDESNSIESGYKDINTYSGTVPFEAFTEYSGIIWEEGSDFEEEKNYSYDDDGFVSGADDYTVECHAKSYNYDIGNGTQAKSQIVVEDPEKMWNEVFFIETKEGTYIDSYGQTKDCKKTIKIETNKEYCMKAITGHIEYSIKTDKEEYKVSANMPLMDISVKNNIKWKYEDTIPGITQENINTEFWDAFDRWEKLLYSETGIHMSDIGFGRAYDQV